MRKICNCKNCVCKSVVEVPDTDWRVECSEKYEQEAMYEDLREWADNHGI